MPEIWFPAVESQSVVGRVVEIEKPHQAKSREAKKPVYIMVPAMEHKVAGSTDISHTEIKEHNRAELCARFPGAWEAYEKSKGGKVGKPTEVAAPDGMPIDRADFIAREKMAWLKLQGFSTVEQLAALNDSQLQSLGPGSRTWKKKAAQLLQKPA